MYYLTEERIAELLSTVNILPITSDDLGDISQYFFDFGEAKEYATFIENEAVELDKLQVSKTYVMIHKETEELIGYFTLSADAVKLTAEEKARGDLENVQFMALPAVKIGKLAINKDLSSAVKKKGYGSLAIEIATSIAYGVINAGVACRFLTVDADIEYDKNTPQFYEKNGFKYNLSRKRRASDKTVSMRRDLICDYEMKD